MIQDVANDFDVLEYSATTAGAVLDTLALVSGSEGLLTRDSKVSGPDFFPLNGVALRSLGPKRG